MPTAVPYNTDPYQVKWSSEQNTPWNPPSHRFAKLAIFATAAGGIGYGLSRKSFEGGTAIDAVYRTARHVGNRSPFSILNTFRVSEMLSPWISPEAQGLKRASQLNVAGGLPGAPTSRYMHWGTEWSENTATRGWLSKMFGTERFQAAGLDTSPFELVFERGKRTSGNLWARREGAADWVKLGQAQIGEVTNISYDFARQKGIRQPGMNQAMQGIGFAHSVVDANKAWTAPGAGSVGQQVSRYAPIPAAIGTEVGGLAGMLSRAKTYIGGPMTQGMLRFNDLLETSFEQLPLLNKTSEAFRKNLSTSIGVAKGPAPKMFARFGMRAAAFGGLVVGVSQTDWIRRQGGAVGHLAATGITTAGLTYGAHMLFRKNPLTMAVGAASAIGQLVLPGYKQGLMPGIATTATQLHVGKSMLGAVTLMNPYRQTLEGLFPGVSDWKTSALVGVGVVGASYMGGSAALIQKFGYGGILPVSLEKFIGVHGGNLATSKVPPPTVRSLYDKEFHRIAQHHLKAEYGTIQGKNQWKWLKNRRLMGALQKRGADTGNWNKIMVELEEAHHIANHKYGQFLLGGEGPPLTGSLSGRIKAIEGTDWSGPTKFAAKMGAKVWHSFLGVQPKVSVLKGDLAAANATAHLGRVGTLFAAGAVGWSLLTGGLLGSMEGPGELRDIYAGRKYVEVRESRGWEAGGRGFEGGEITTLKPHAYVTYMARARQKSIWGVDEDEISPIKKFLLKNFTYEMERRMGRSRPHPISGAAFQDVPIIGGALASTIGQLIKPARLMYVNEWVRPGPNGEMEFAHAPEMNPPAYELGGRSPGVPTSPMSPVQQAAFLDYQGKELAGLMGWASNTFFKKVTGSDLFAAQRPVLESAGEVASAQHAWWSSELGGMLGLSEGIRRFLPRTMSEMEGYNPIVNDMPHWMPDRFHYGDPYRNLSFGHVRLPGPGYAAIHPELKKVDPNNYPDAYKYLILSDVASNSREFRSLRERMYKKRAQGLTTSSEEKMIDFADQNLRKVMVEEFSGLHQNAIQIPGVSKVTQGLWATAKKALRKTVAPAEYLTPFRPVQKFMADRDVIEAYEYERLYGTPMAFWDKPQRDFIRPAFYSALDLMSPVTFKPGFRKEVNETNEYFDKLEFAKWMQIADTAQTPQERRKALYKAQQTRHGVNPQGNPMSIYMALPDDEKKFFDAFATASKSQRSKILSMIPEDQHHLYKAIWSRMDSGEEMYPGAPTTIDEAYLQQQRQELSGFFSGQKTPPEDWIGYHEDVDVSDIQLRYIESLGKDIHDYGMWDREVRQMVRKPYLEGSEDFLFESNPRSRDMLASGLYRAGQTRPDQGVNLSVHSHAGSSFNTQGRFYYDDNRESAIMELMNAFR